MRLLYFDKNNLDPGGIAKLARTLFVRAELGKLYIFDQLFFTFCYATMQSYQP